MRPWEEGGGAADPLAQQACYRAVIEAMADATWLSGAYWWKWFSGGAAEGSGGLSYSPRGKPAEAELRAALRQWQGRPVRVPAAAR